MFSLSSLNEGDLDLLGFIDEENAKLIENADGDVIPFANHRLKVAVDMLDAGSVDTWLKNGADPNYAYGPNRVRCIHLAVNLRSVEIVHALVKAGADVNATDARGVTPLHVAASAGVLGIIQLLVRSGAEVNVKDLARENGGGQESPLHRAAFRGHADAVRKLVSLGAQV